MEKKTGMVDVGHKNETERIARAQSLVCLNKDLINKIKNNEIPKGSVLEVARVAAIMAVKKTQDLIPHCHTINIDYTNVDFLFKTDGLLITSVVKTHAKTGVEMEALVACSVAALTIYDMCKMFSKNIKITDTYLLEKFGGKNGDFIRGEG